MAIMFDANSPTW